MAIEFNLNDICDMKILLGEDSDKKTEIMNKLKLTEKHWLINSEYYHTIKYNKSKLTSDSYSTSGKLRSIIYKNNKILAFSPPKSIDYNHFNNKYDLNSCYTEDFIEGTMINLFYDHDIDTWVYATKSCVGANVYFFNPNTKCNLNNKEDNKEDNTLKNKTFGEMFLEVCEAANINFDLFPKEYSYNFVFQHPENRIVIPITKMYLYLVRVYSINNEHYTITEVNKEEIINTINCQQVGDTIQRFLYWPNAYAIYNIEELKNNVESKNMPYNILGIMIYSPDGTRTKLRNPNYEEIRQLRGNQAKLQYQYLVLRQNGKMNDFLLYYPEYKKMFSLYREQLHRYTDTLFNNYIKCFIKKEMKLGAFPHDYKTHMFNLHKYYLDELREKKLSINKIIVQNYVNNVHPALLMYTLNYNKRKHYMDQKICDSIGM